jgi:hypothetical protein
MHGGIDAHVAKVAGVLTKSKSSTLHGLRDLTESAFLQ